MNIVNLITIVLTSVMGLTLVIYFFYNLLNGRKNVLDIFDDEPDIDPSSYISFVKQVVDLISNQVSEHNYWTSQDTFVKKDNKVSSPLVFDPLNDTSERIFCDYCGSFQTIDNCDVEDGKIIMFCTSCHYTNEYLTRQTSSKSNDRNVTISLFN